MSSNPEPTAIAAAGSPPHPEPPMVPDTRAGPDGATRGNSGEGAVSAMAHLIRRERARLAGSQAEEPGSS